MLKLRFVFLIIIILLSYLVRILRILDSENPTTKAGKSFAETQK